MMRWFNALLPKEERFFDLFAQHSKLITRDILIAVRRTFITPFDRGAITLFMATWLGIPVSTTHTITGAIIGVGAAKRASGVRWGVAHGIVMAGS